MPVRDLQETFPPLDARHIGPRHAQVWARICGEWRAATVILWLWGANDHVVVLRESASPAEQGEPAEIAYHYDEAALRLRLGGQMPPDQWRWTCTPAQARRLWPMRRYRPWPACPGCGAAIDSVSYADSARTILIVLPCGQGLRTAEETDETDET